MRRTPIIRGLLPILDADWLERIELVSAAEIRRFYAGQESVIQTIARRLGASSALSCVQVRCKDRPERCASFAALWVEALRRYSPHVTVIINDHVELAIQLAADGVHVGQEDRPVALCRRLLGREKLIGLSTHTLAEVAAAHEAGVDYIGFGPLFTTQTKPDAQAAQGIARLAEVCQHARQPVVAIGGIQNMHMAEIAATGAAAVAMISGIWGTEGENGEKKEGWLRRLEQAERAWHASQPDATTPPGTPRIFTP
ncbi:MAG: thiamine phosphate synthase [Magnetococcales bacterium]|nr:thiamine phosphate synthase [Magnetococcales bacterium]